MNSFNCNNNHFNSEIEKTENVSSSNSIVKFNATPQSSILDHRELTSSENFVCKGINNFHLNESWLVSESRLDQQPLSQCFFDALQSQKAPFFNSYHRAELNKQAEHYFTSHLLKQHQAYFMPALSYYQRHPLLTAEFNKIRLNHSEMMRRNFLRNIRVPSNDFISAYRHCVPRTEFSGMENSSMNYDNSNQRYKKQYRKVSAINESHKPYQIQIQELTNNIAPPKKKWMKNFIRGKY